jgi:OmpA-OmpF porin, OOP family
MRRARLAVALASTLSAAATAAQAQTLPSLELRNFAPPTDPEGSFYLEPVTTPAAGEWNVGAWLSYGHRLVSLQDSNGSELAVPLRHQLSLDYAAGIGIGRRVALGIRLPTVLYQQGDDVTALLGGERLPHTSIGDVAFGTKFTLMPMGELGGYGLAVLGSMTLPTGDPASYLSDGAVTGEGRLLGEANLVALSVRATAGFRGRTHPRSFAGERFSNTLPWGLGIAFRPQVLGIDDAGRLSWLVDLHGAVAVTPEFASGPQSPALVSFGTRYTVDHVSAIVGAEIPMTSAVGTPDVRGVIGIGWAPRFYDVDQDGIDDEVDECPELAEDVDGFQDQDGCLDFDNDEDGVPDAQDKCPKGLEDADGFEDEDGCPDPDNDRDGILDAQDKCPGEPGPAETKGCAVHDTDQDGVPDHLDRCPKRAEDRDGFEDEDGCPDPDNDDDRIIDQKDACPKDPGPLRSDPALSGCPSPDRDGDSFDDGVDKCPDAAEDFDGIEDEDGCPDDESVKPAAQRPKPLVGVEEQGPQRSVRFVRTPKFETDAGATTLAKGSLDTARAMAQVLNGHPRWVMLIGVRPRAATPEAEQRALTEAFALVQTLRALTHRDEVAEPVGWAAVKRAPGATAAGVGVLVVETPEPPPRPRTRVVPRPLIPRPPKPPPPAQAPPAPPAPKTPPTPPPAQAPPAPPAPKTP